MRTKKIITVLVSLFLFVNSGCEKEDLRNEDLTRDLAIQKAQGKKALPHTKQYHAEVATAWFDLLTDISKKTPYFNPQSIRIFVYSGLALYESVVPGMPSYQSMYTYLTDEVIEVGKRKDYYWPAVANAALARISDKLLADYPQRPDLTALSQLEADFNAAFLTEISAEQLELSNQFGRHVADVIHAWSRKDGTFNEGGGLAFCPPYIPGSDPENWIPTPPFFFPAAGACQGDLRTFIEGVTTSSMPPPPPAYSTNPASEFYKMNEEIFELSFNLSPEDIVNNQAWRDIFVVNTNTPTHMFQLTTDLIEKEELDLEITSVIYAKQGMAMFDAIASAMTAKYEYKLLRPVTYIQRVIDDGWDGAYPAPQHPSYPSIQPAAVTAVVTVLEQYFGANYHFEDATQEALYGVWSYNSFMELVEYVGRSRTHSGINYQLSVDVGISQGREIGDLINQLPFKK